MDKFIPYTYLIGWKEHDIWYYGSKYGKNANPTLLFNFKSTKPYLTSSKYVNEFRYKFGEPDVVEVRKIFTSREECIEWEHKVLRRIKAVKSNKWLNKTDNKAISSEKAKISSRDRRWFTNGVDNLYLDVDIDEIPKLFVRGRTVKWKGESTLNKIKPKPYTNGIITIYIFSVKDRPNGKEWKSGYGNDVKGIDFRTINKRSYYNNGKVTKLLFEHEVTKEWSLGKLKAKQKH